MLSLHEVAEMTRGRVVVARTHADAVRVFDVSTDSRAVAPGSLFVALSGERFDGHAYLDDVAARGAAAALVVEGRTATALPLVEVDDTRRALGDLAAGWRRRFSMPLVAVVGSNGKTTTKEMIAAIFAAAFGENDRCATRGNLNNDIGVPLTLLGLRTHHRAAVIELGMNHPGETARLAEIAQPSIVLVVNAQREHQEFMRSVAAVAAEHALAIDALTRDGVAVFPADDSHAEVWRRAAGKCRIVDFACTTDHRIDVPAASVVARAHLDVEDMVIHFDTPLGTTTVRLAASGLHNARNAAAAVAACVAAGTIGSAERPTAADISLDAIRRGLEAFLPMRGRSQRFVSRGGSAVIDDSYNANPDSMLAAIDLLATHAPPRLLILGDMGEVGSEGPRFHAEIGAHAREAGIEALYATGTASRATVTAFGERGAHFDDVEALIEAARTWLVASEPHARRSAPSTQAEDPTPSVLVKGSRFMRMERVVAALCAVDLAEGAH